MKTTAQQEAERNAEKAEKVKAYTKAMTDILDRRDQGVKDQLQLKTTGMVLMGNPDISTLWNIRKQVLEHFRDEK